MRLQTIVVLGFLAGVVGCDDASSPVAPSAVEQEVSTFIYAPVYRGRCPADSDLPFSLRENGWYWADTCRNDHGEIVELRAWCSGARRVDRDFCVLNTPPTRAALDDQRPHRDGSEGSCRTMAASSTHISGGTAPYQLASFGGRWVTSAPCRGDTPTRYTLLGPGQAVWSATGLDPGDSAQVTVTDADGERETFTVQRGIVAFIRGLRHFAILSTSFTFQQRSARHEQRK